MKGQPTLTAGRFDDQVAKVQQIGEETWLGDGDVLYFIQGCLERSFSNAKWTPFDIDEAVVGDAIDIIAPIFKIVPKPKSSRK